MKRTRANGDNVLHRAQQGVSRLEREIYALGKMVETIERLEAQGDRREYEPGDWRGRLSWVEGELEELGPRLAALLAQTRALVLRL